MATVVVQQQLPLRHSITPPPLAPALKLNAPRSTTPVPNRHIPYCPPGPSPNLSQIVTPPNSPPARTVLPKSTSILYPAAAHKPLLLSPPIHGIDGKTLAAALEHLASQGMPDPSHVFPWLHGLHPDNHIQQAFFVARKKSLRRTPKCLRSITVVKAGGDLTHSRIKGAVAPDEILSLFEEAGKGFLDCDPREGFSVRNFHIQTAKMAQVSDIVIYGDDQTDHRIIRSVAERASSVQRKWMKCMDMTGQCPEEYGTFVLTTPFEDFERDYPQLVAVDAHGKTTGEVMDFLLRERLEMCEMSKASEVSQGVFQGPTPDWATLPEDDMFDLFIEASDQAQMPDPPLLNATADLMGDAPVHIAFPSSGSILPPSWSQHEVEGIIAMCEWLYKLTTSMSVVEPTKDGDGDIPMVDLFPKPRKVLLHCADGYTETSLLTVAYYVFSHGVPVHQAWTELHRDKGRNFFAYPSDVALLLCMQDRLLARSPVFDESLHCPIIAPLWLAKFDGSLPSRILPYMYLGNLTHANNPELLHELGISRIVSVGEPVGWTPDQLESWGRDNLMMVDRVQDNGIDPLTGELERCLKFIARGKPFSRDSGATLVHCRVGVSRSATICIAEVMSEIGLSFPRAYCFVRARRLNVIIQPHLRFVYELMKWDEQMQMKRSHSAAQPKPQRALEWSSVCREIAAMNRPYARG